MSRLAASAFAIVMFVLGALAVGAAQESREVLDRQWQQAVYLPIVPKVGQEIYFEKARCAVREVRREWVRCDGGSQWRNVYNGQQYTVRDAVPAP